MNFGIELFFYNIREKVDLQVMNIVKINAMNFGTIFK